MGAKSGHASGVGAVWRLVERQHGVVAYRQLLELGYGRAEVRSRIESGRLHRVHRGVFAVGRPALTDRGRWIAATLSVEGSLLSHLDAAYLHELLERRARRIIELSVESGSPKSRRGLRVHRRRPGLLGEGAVVDGIRLTDAADTVIDIASRVGRAALERAVNEADKLGLATPRQIRERAGERPRRPGAAVVARLLDAATFVLSDSELERRFLPLARSAGLGLPRTRVRVDGHLVDFHWPELGLVIETDGGRFHRTPVQQRRDRRRDQAHTAAGRTVLRFTHGQVRHEPAEVLRILRETVARIGDRNPASVR